MKSCGSCTRSYVLFGSVVVALVASFVWLLILLRRYKEALVIEVKLCHAARRGPGPRDGEMSKTSHMAAWEVDFSELKFGRCLAEGGYGMVYAGSWLGTKVAIKTPKGRMSDNVREKFMEEAHLMSRMHHPNIVMFLGASTNTARIALVLEYLPRGSLDDFLKNDSNDISLPLIHRIAVDTARGMKYLHSRCVIQRDLKPSNLLLDFAYNTKVGDFGLSRYFSGARESMTSCGTPYWTAPEITRSEQYGTKADVYSYAIILLQLISREEPYAGMPGLQVAVNAAQRNLRPRIPSFCPEHYQQLIRTCWDNDPINRPDFSQILEQLNVIKKSHSNASSSAKGASMVRPVAEV